MVRAIVALPVCYCAAICALILYMDLYYCQLMGEWLLCCFLLLISEGSDELFGVLLAPSSSPLHVVL